MAAAPSSATLGFSSISALLLIMLLVLQQCAFFAASSSSPPSTHLVILKAERRIDLTSPIVRAVLTLKVENSGKSSSSEVMLAFPTSLAEQIAMFNAAVVEGKKKKKTYTPLVVARTEISDVQKDAQMFSVSLLSPLSAGETVSLEIILVFTHVLKPFPDVISQSESQLVLFHDTALILSPYVVKDQTTYIKTPNSRIESYTKLNPVSQTGSEIKYGAYDERPPFSFSPITVHFENNHPFAIVEELTCEVEVSHWGSVQVTEHYKLVHGGARHNGVFSRVEYQSRPTLSGVSSFKRLLARLPPRVHSVYYRDNIGNISSSHLRVGHVKSELEIEPRYPLFGGWKASFILGYGLPLQDVLFESSDGRRYLNFTFGCPLVETSVDKFIVKVVLPEGSTDPSITAPFAVKQHQEKSYSYLDIIGRPVIVLEKENVVPEHNVPFQVYYGFKPISMLAEPLILVTAFFLLFVTCIAYQHMNLSLSKF